MTVESDAALRESGDGVLLSVHAQPGGRRDEVGGLHGGRLRVRTTAPPADGRANRRIAELVAEAFGLPRRRVELVAGASSRRKELLLADLDLATARSRLDELAG